jgi:hypothetical protein
MVHKCFSHAVTGNQLSPQVEASSQEPHPLLTTSTARPAHLLVILPIIFLASPAAVPCCLVAPTQTPVSHKSQLTSARQVAALRAAAAQAGKWQGLHQS